MLTLRVLGPLEAELDSEPVALPESGRVRALLGWLAVNPGMHSRSELAGRLRPDVLEESARKSLRQAVWELRRALGEAGEQCIQTSRGRVGLGGPGVVQVDLQQLRARLGAGDLEGALALRRGPLLAGLDDDWIDSARRELDGQIEAALERQAEQAERDGDLDQAVTWSRRLAEIDPLSERVHRELIRRLVAVGDRAGALTAYEAYAERLRRDLRVAPSSETRRLVEAIRAGGQPAAAAGPAAPGVPPAASGPTPSMEAPSPAATAPATTATPGAFAVPTAPADATAPAARPAAPDAGDPIPAPLRSAAPFVGREDALDALRRAWECAAAGTGCTALIAGEPGIGKTRLAGALAEAVVEGGGVVRYGRCDEVPLRPYQPFAEALGSGVWGAAPPQAVAQSPEHERFQLFEQIRSALAAGHPSMLVLDDVHWADAATLALLRHLARAAGELPVLIVTTYRDTALDRTEALGATLADVARIPNTVRVALRGLARDEVVELVTRRGGTRELAPELHARTAGNPLFVAEVLRDLHERTGDDLSGPVPQTVKDVIAERLARLGELDAAILRLLSLLSSEVEVGVVEAVAREVAGAGALPGVEPERALDALDAAVVARLVVERPGGRYAFGHALVGEALQEQLSAARRARLHGAIAAGLERHYGADAGAHAAEIAAHYTAAAAGRPSDAAVAWEERAAEAAAAALAFEEAADHYERALAALGPDAPPPRRAELLEGLGAARMRAGAREQGQEAFAAAGEIARAEGDGPALARAALGLGGVGVVIGEPDDALLDLLHAARDALDGDDEGGWLARVLARTAVELYYRDPMAADELSEEAVTRARASGDPSTLAYALNARRVALWGPEHADERLAVATEIVELATEVNDAEGELRGRNWRVLDLLELGRRDEVDAEIDRYEKTADALGLPHYRWYVPLWRCGLALMEGRFEDARRLREQARELGHSAEDPNAELFAGLQAMGEQLERGRLDLIDRAWALAKAEESASPEAWVTLRGLFDLIDGNRDAARAKLEGLLAGGAERVASGANWHTACEAADLCAMLGDVEHARMLYGALKPLARLNPVVARAVHSYVSTEYYLARLALTIGEPDAAVGHAERAIEAARRLRARPRLGYARLELARALIARGDDGDTARAAAELSAAEADAQLPGMEVLSAEIDRARDDLVG